MELFERPRTEDLKFGHRVTRSPPGRSGSLGYFCRPNLIKTSRSCPVIREIIYSVDSAQHRNRGRQLSVGPGHGESLQKHQAPTYVQAIRFPI